MSRTLTTEQQRALADEKTIWGLFFDIHHPDGIVRIWNGIGSIEYSESGRFNPPLVFLGAGHIASFSGFENALRTRIQQVKMQLSNIPNQAIPNINTEVRGRPAFISLGIINENRQIVGNFINLMLVRLDYSTVVIDSNLTSTLTIIGNSGLIDLRNPSRRAFTKAEQLRRYPNIDDTGLDDIPHLQNRNIVWNQGTIRT